MVSTKHRGVEVGDFGWGIMYGITMSGLLMLIVWTIAYQYGVRVGRTDIASGRVTATQVVNADGLTEWKFDEGLTNGMHE